MKAVAARTYNPKQYTIDEFIQKNQLEVRSRPFEPTTFPGLNYHVNPDRAMDMNIFKPLDSLDTYVIEDPLGERDIENGLMRAFVSKVDARGMRRVASLDFWGTVTYDTAGKPTSKNWYWLAPLSEEQ